MPHFLTALPVFNEVGHVRAVLDEVRRNCYRAGARQVFPFDLVRISMRGVAVFIA